MLDIKRIIENRAEAEKALAKRGEYSFDKVIELDKKRRAMILDVEAKKAERNNVTQRIAKLKREKADASALIADMGNLAAQIKELDASLAQTEEELNGLLASYPNFPDDDIAAVINHERSSWGNRAPLVTAADVFAYLGALERIVGWVALALAPGQPVYVQVKGVALVD